MKNKEIRVFRTQNFSSGGRAYEELVCSSLNGNNSYRATLEPVKGILPFNKGLRLQQVLRLAFFDNSKKNTVDIRSFLPTISLLINKNSTSKHISIFHHFDPFWQPGVTTTELLFNLFLFSCKKFVSKTVVVSKFWEDFLGKRGVNNIKVIYNSFDVGYMNMINNEDCSEFKKKYEIGDKKIIYIGNNNVEKGTYVAFHQLNGKFPGSLLMASGKPTGKEPFRVLDLNYKEYLTLLKLSECVVAYSLFNEGWCRTAHEAMILRTPVVGSGKGGMKELLVNGGQGICNDPRDLADYVSEAISNRDELGQKAYKYAASFDLVYFKKEWLQLIDEVLGQ